jgi:hypothetical protein
MRLGRTRSTGQRNACQARARPASDHPGVNNGIQGVPLMNSTQLLGAVSVLVVLASLGSAYMATRSPARRGVFERSSGILFIAGLALLGFTFPIP